MKRTLSALLFTSLFISSAALAERIPFTTTLCYKGDATPEWKYSTTGNVKNGERDHTGQIRLDFGWAYTADGGKIHTLIYQKIDAIQWDAGFKNVVADFDENHHVMVVCASGHRAGHAKKLQGCTLEGRVVEVAADADCGGQKTFQYQGEFVINRWVLSQ